MYNILPEEMKKSIYIEGYKKTRRVVLPQGLKFFADAVTEGTVFRRKIVIKEFADKCISKYSLS